MLLVELKESETFGTMKTGLKCEQMEWEERWDAASLGE